MLFDGQGAHIGRDIEQIRQGNLVFEGPHAALGIAKVDHGPKYFDVAVGRGAQVTLSRSTVEIDAAAILAMSSTTGRRRPANVTASTATY